MGRIFVALLAALAWVAAMPAPERFRFVILGDRTGETQPGVYEQAWKEASKTRPAFVLTVGDTIEGSRDLTAEAEWQKVEKTLLPYRSLRLYLTPGNHDIWSPLSEALFRQHSGHASYYSFDHVQAHFTVLDNSRSDDLSPRQLRFLEEDLQAHAVQPLKFIVSHRPSWIIPVVLENPKFPLHELAKKYGVQFVIAGHVHQMFHVNLEGVTYLSMPSAGGHLRASMKYRDGWFFAFTQVDVSGDDVRFRIRELQPPHGEGRVTRHEDWGRSGLKLEPAAK